MKETNETEDKNIEEKAETQPKNIKPKIELKEDKVIVTLGGPITFNGEKIGKIELDFNSITGAEICEAESESLGKFFTPLPDVNYSTAYQAAIAAKASGIPFEAILELKSKDFRVITECTKGFLLG
ncbi:MULTISPECIES: hypothetical protein [Psychrilyobacter]|uniref:Phage tail assembly chaperone protein, E, or 41 or 14 n=1 Tax=Psychrilyobacter piezotolerans TaxID=2293438 RepID=A0ABX9KJB8_9FUSO|nr:MULTISPECIES: hypothetical protein [Psychrilyobacter]MCS5421248.1 hypothetical protein [Psychrilyobacter sp. S5]NDI76995.1 hypothetical protein [Psychrilyobacter piezotolerans]RDE64612.1 hypothetical protein DV867_03465 [Psychrilyobacter sp. S5]REI42424.1 hypothetical protein DYH56_03465 [Psychrilyobacter piezotolerans]